MAIDAVSGSFTGVAAGASAAMSGDFNVSLSDFGVATVRLERSFDDGATWLVVESYTGDTERLVTEPEKHVLWRFNCTSHTSGTIVWRISR